MPIQHACMLSRVWHFTHPWTVACQAPPSMVHKGSPGKNTGAGCHFPFQGIFLTQRLNLYLLCLLHCRRIPHLLSPQGSPYISDLCDCLHIFKILANCCTNIVTVWIQNLDTSEINPPWYSLLDWLVRYGRSLLCFSASQMLSPLVQCFWIHSLSDDRGIHLMQASEHQWLPVAYISYFWTLKFLTSTKVRLVEINIELPIFVLFSENIENLKLETK